MELPENYKILPKKCKFCHNKNVLILHNFYKTLLEIVSPPLVMNPGYGTAFF